MQDVEIPGGLSPDIRRTLGLLHDAPPGVAESTIAMLGFGSRSALLACDPPLIIMSSDGLIAITDAGKRVIERLSETSR